MSRNEDVYELAAWASQFLPHEHELATAVWVMDTGGFGHAELRRGMTAREVEGAWVERDVNVPLI
jgi:hypothetical protein